MSFRPRLFLDPETDRVRHESRTQLAGEAAFPLETAHRGPHDIQTDVPETYASERLEQIRRPFSAQQPLADEPRECGTTACSPQSTRKSRSGSGSAS